MVTVSWAAALIPTDDCSSTAISQRSNHAWRGALGKGRGAIGTQAAIIQTLRVQRQGRYHAGFCCRTRSLAGAQMWTLLQRWIVTVDIMVALPLVWGSTAI